jgi:hypothetical protein
MMEECLSLLVERVHLGRKTEIILVFALKIWDIFIFVAVLPQHRAK